MPFCVGVDLGQAADYTAAAVVQSVKEPVGNGSFVSRLHLRHLERYPLHTPYPEIADKVAALVRSPEIRPTEYDPARARHFSNPPELAVDNTGVGRAVTDLMKTRDLKFRPITITGGDKVSAVNGGYRVPKRDLVAALEVPFHTGELRVAEGLELWPALKKELLNFRRKINLATAHDSYEHWRDSDHDDLVLAVALACWWMRRRGSRLRVLRKPPGF